MEKYQTTEIYSHLDKEDVSLIAALLRELGYGAEGNLADLHIYWEDSWASWEEGTDNMTVKVKWTREATGQ